MAKYYIDTEFIEGFHKPLFGKRRHFIDLISIGIFCEDGREYYAISNEFNPKDADQWVRDNVLKSLPSKTGVVNHLIYGKSFVFGDDCKSNIQIAREIINFCRPNSRKADEAGIVVMEPIDFPEFYGYYSDYDWVLFCSLFGRMIDLPKGFPMYCIDLKQILDERAEWVTIPGVETFKDRLAALKNRPHYPKQDNEHNALDDAKWNYKLHQFLKTI